MTFGRIMTLGASAALASFVWAGGAAAALVHSGTNCNVSSVSGATACAGIYNGNDSNQDLDGLFDPSYNWIEVLKLDSSGGTESDGGISLTVDNANKTWSVDTYAGNDPVMFVLKGGPSFSAFLMDTSVLSGTWDNLSMLTGGKKPKRGPGLSHWTIYSAGQGSTTAPVPLPASALLLLGGIAGLGGIRRLRHKS